MWKSISQIIAIKKAELIPSATEKVEKFFSLENVIATVNGYIKKKKKEVYI